MLRLRRPPQDARRGEAAISRSSGSTSQPETPVAGLSIAQQQLVEIAKALSLNARVLIMDEPTSSLTLAETARLHEVVAGLRARGVAIIYITHRLGEVQTIADRAVVLRDGANAGALAREELTHDNMIRLMVGRDLDTAHQPTQCPGPRDYFQVEALRTRRYPQHAVSFGVARGEILGVAGLVGAGRPKSPRRSSGVEPPIAGTMRLDGSDSADRRAGRCDSATGVFLVPEDRRSAGLVVDFSIRENVSLPALAPILDVWAGVGGPGTRRRRRDLPPAAGQGAVDRGHDRHARAAATSRRWCSPSGSSLGPRVLIVDEPTRGIDVGAKAEIYRLLRDLAGRGRRRS